MQADLGAFASVPDYAYDITRDIWEERSIGNGIRRYYTDDVLVRAPNGLSQGIDGVIAMTLQSLALFPDRQLVGLDVIWAAFPDGSFLSSHRTMSVSRHAFDGAYGKPSGRLVRGMIIADCWVRTDQKIQEEWLVRDQAAVAACIGLEPRALARDMLERDLRAGGPVTFFTPERDRQGVFRPVIQDDEAIAALMQGLRRLWHDKETAVIRDLYARGAALHAPGGVVRYGHGDIDTFVLGYLASFPDAAFTVDSAHVNRDPESPVRVALRWSLAGSHSGFGHFGEPTGAPVYVMGISHVHLSQGRIVAEFMMVDEVAIWKQILAHTESRAGA